MATKPNAKPNEFDFTEECRERVSQDLRDGEQLERSLIGEPEGYDELRLRQTKVGRLTSMMTEQSATMLGLDRLFHGRRRPNHVRSTIDDLERPAPGEANQLAGKQLAVTLTDRRLLFHDLTDAMLPDGYIGSYQLDAIRLNAVTVIGGKRILEVVFSDDSVLSLNCPLFQPVIEFVARYDEVAPERDASDSDYGPDTNH